MKHRIGVFLSMSLICLPFIVSCEEKDDKKVDLYRRDNIDTTVRLVSEEELEDVTRYDSCMVFVALTGCHYCEMTKDILKQYISNTSTIIYEVERYEYSMAYDNESNHSGTWANMYPKLSGFPAILFYENGQLVNSHLGSLSSYDDMITLAKNSVNITENYLLNDMTYSESYDSYVMDSTEEYEETKDILSWGFSTTYLDKVITEKKNVPVLFSWRKCGDCKNYRKNVLSPFRKQHPDKRIYFYETDGYMTGKRSENAKTKKFVLNIWSTFCDKYHLNDYSKIDELGNNAGFVPTIVNYNNGINDYKLSVYSNYLDININDDNTLSYKKAFYPELTEIKSKTKVDDGDYISTKFQKAKKDLDEKIQEADNRLNLAFLQGLL